MYSWLNPRSGRDDDVLGGVQLLEAPEVHGLLQQRNDVGIESLPVWVLEVILLALQDARTRRRRGLVFVFSIVAGIGLSVCVGEPWWACSRWFVCRGLYVCVCICVCVCVIIYVGAWPMRLLRKAAAPLVGSVGGLTPSFS